MSDRTEAPTPFRRSEARRKGQVAKSVEVNSAVIMLASFWLLSLTTPGSYRALAGLMRDSFSALSATDITLTTVQAQGLTIAVLMVQAAAPLALALLALGIAANLGQVGLMFSTHALQPDFNKINPLTGFKRLLSPRGLVDLGKSLLKVGIIGLIVYQVLRDNYAAIAATSRMSLTAAIGAITDIGLSMGYRVALAMVVIAVADFFYQRYEFEKNLRMSKQEIREEMKRFENPQLKARIRARQRQLAISRMMSAVPQADVVITNPTHIAVALKYQQGKMHAPEVVAKGQRLVAERIKEQARQHNIPLVENKPLARTIFKSVEIGQGIPADLFQAVAEVLAFVYRLKSQAGAPRTRRD